MRLPASYCGIYGIRTTHGLVPADGVVDLAASFDTVGWFARDAGDDEPGRRCPAAGRPRLRAEALADRRGRIRFRGRRDHSGTGRRRRASQGRVRRSSRGPRSTPATLRRGPEFSAFCRATKFGAGTAPGSTPTIRASVPASPSGFAGRAPSIPPRSSACGRNARTWPATWTHFSTTTRCCACRRRRASRRSSRPRRRARSVSRARFRVVVDRRSCAPAANLAAARHNGRLPARALADRAAWPRPGFALLGSGQNKLKRRAPPCRGKKVYKLRAMSSFMISLVPA